MTLVLSRDTLSAMIGVLLVNLGTPANPSPTAVRAYLREFLSDPRVIDINPFARWILVNLIIAPFRARPSSEAYEKIWTRQGSPLLLNTQDLGREVGRELGAGYKVEIAMRYGQPSIEIGMKNLIDAGAEVLRVLPLYPQYASSSTGSTQEMVYRLSGSIPNCPPIQMLLPFFDNPGYIRSFAEIGEPLLQRFKPDVTLFSFHGLPERQILKGDIGGNYCLKNPDCCDEIVPANGLCYRAHCVQSARLIAERLGISKSDYILCFQSRLGATPWIKPYTDLVIEDLLKAGKKRIAVFCPAFVADCLETLEEIGIRAFARVRQAGGDLLLIPSLNAHPTWVKAVSAMLKGE